MDVLDIVREEVVREIESRVPTADARFDNRGRCIQASHVGMNALAYFGIETTPLMTLMITGNQAWVDWMEKGSPQPMPDEVWSVGIDARPTGKGMPGHLVLTFDGYLLDLDAGFYSRPAKGIHIPPSVLAPLATDPQHIANGNVCGVDLDDGGVILYGEHDRLDYKSTRAWRHTKKWAGPVIRRTRERLGNGA